MRFQIVGMRLLVYNTKMNKNKIKSLVRELSVGEMEDLNFYVINLRGLKKNIERLEEQLEEHNNYLIRLEREGVGAIEEFAKKYGSDETIMLPKPSEYMRYYRYTWWYRVLSFFKQI